MKSWPQLFCVLSILCAFPAAAAPGSPTGPTRTEEKQMAAPLAEMMFYEAAEQAVQDSYATIIPDSEGKTQDAADTNSEKAGQATTPPATEPQTQKK